MFQPSKSQPHGVLLTDFSSEANKMIYSLNTVKHNCLIKILVTGSLILHAFRQHVSVVERQSSGLQCLTVLTLSRPMIYIYIYIYRVIQEESAIFWEMILCVILSKKVLNGYRDMVKRRYGPSCEHEQQLRKK